MIEISGPLTSKIDRNSALYKKLSDANGGTRTSEFYLKHGRFTLGICAPMIIFCDETTQPSIQAIRDELVPNSQTVYIVKPIYEYDYYER